MDTFAELPYSVLWKFENDSLPNLPNNVVIKKWVPQQDVLGKWPHYKTTFNEFETNFSLAHPKVKVFFSQCGLQSTEEAVARGVPIVGIPFIADQELNAKRLEENGVGINIDFTTMTKEKLKNAIIEVAENKK